MSNVISNVTERLIYDNCNAMLSANGFDLSRFKRTQSFLRTEQPIAVNQSLYEFPVLTTEANPQIFNTEQRLNQQDSFLISGLMVYLALPSSATDTTFDKLHYADPNVFGVSDAAALNALFNSGELQIMVDNNVLVTAWDVARHKVIPQTQATGAWGAGSPLTQDDGATYGIFPMEPNVTLVGSKNNKISITLPKGLTVAPANSRIGIYYRGILIQNSTVVN